MSTYTEEDVCILIFVMIQTHIMVDQDLPLYASVKPNVVHCVETRGEAGFSSHDKMVSIPPLAPLHLDRYPLPHLQNLIVSNIGKWCLSHIGKWEFDLVSPPLLNCT